MYFLYSCHDSIYPAVKAPCPKAVMEIVRKNCVSFYISLFLLLWPTAMFISQYSFLLDCTAGVVRCVFLICHHRQKI